MTLIVETLLGGKRDREVELGVGEQESEVRSRYANDAKRRAVDANITTNDRSIATVLALPVSVREHDLLVLSRLFVVGQEQSADIRLCAKQREKRGGNRERADTLRAIGGWLQLNGEAIYGTHNWITFGEGGGRGSTGVNVRYTVKGDTLYAILLGAWPGPEVVIPSLATGKDLGGQITSVTMLGVDGGLKFTRDDAGLKVMLPATAPGQYGYTLKIAGLTMNPTTVTRSGNPEL